MLDTCLDHVYQIELQDISGCMKAVWTLPDCEKRLEEIIDTVADGTVTVNQQGLITTFNSAAEKFLEKKGSYLTLPSIAFLPTFVGIQTIHKHLIKKFMGSCSFMKMKARR